MLTVGVSVSGGLTRGKVVSNQVKHFEYKEPYWPKTTADVVTNPTRLNFKISVFSCRDQAVPSFVGLLRKFDETYPKTSLSSIGSVAKTNDKIIWHNQVTLALLGDTNRDFSMIASPYIFRWVVGYCRSSRPIASLGRTTDFEKIRAALLGEPMVNQWFYDLMLLADTEGVRLNENMREAWDIRMTPSYTMQGLQQLHMGTKTYNWPTMFPPSVLKGRILK